MSSNNFQVNLTGENGPDYPAVDALKQFELLQRMADPKKHVGPYGHMIKELLRYTDAAAVALEDPVISSNVGGKDFPQLMAVATIMRKQQISDQTEAIIRKYLPAPRKEVTAVLGSSISSSSSSSSGP